MVLPVQPEGAAQVSQDGIGLVQGEVSVLEPGELPIQLMYTSVFSGLSGFSDWLLSLSKMPICVFSWLDDFLPSLNK